MEITRKNLKRLIESYLKEATASEATASADISYNYDPASGIYSAKKASLDPYTYKVIASNNTDITVKVITAPQSRQSAVGRTFKINKNNLQNPNVQLLYSAIRHHQSKTIQGDTGADFVPVDAEFIDIGQLKQNQFSTIFSIFQSQHDRIKQLGHESPKSVLKQSQSQQFNGIVSYLSNQSITNMTDLSKYIVADFESNIPNAEVVSIIYYGNLSEDTLCCAIMAKTGSLEYTVYNDICTRSVNMSYEKHKGLRNPQDTARLIQVSSSGEGDTARSSNNFKGGEGESGTLNTAVENVLPDGPSVVKSEKEDCIRDGMIFQGDSPKSFNYKYTKTNKKVTGNVYVFENNKIIIYETSKTGVKDCNQLNDKTFRISIKSLEEDRSGNIKFTTAISNKTITMTKEDFLSKFYNNDLTIKDSVDSLEFT